MHFERKKFDEALANYKKSLALKPDFAAAWLGVGNVHLQQRRYDAAFIAYDEANS